MGSISWAHCSVSARASIVRLQKGGPSLGDGPASRHAMFRNLRIMQIGPLEFCRDKAFLKRTCRVLRRCKWTRGCRRTALFRTPHQISLSLRNAAAVLLFDTFCAIYRVEETLPRGFAKWNRRGIWPCRLSKLLKACN